MRTAPEAIDYYNRKQTNTPAACQHETWVAYQSHSVGDVDHDGDADAVDGWKSEPVSARHTGKRPKIGAPCAWSGGSGGFGHRAICVAYVNGVPQIRSTDAGGRGIMGTKPLPFFEEVWHLNWLGSSDTISGQPIVGLKAAPSLSPAKTPAKKPVKKSRGTKIDQSLVLAKQAKAVKGSPRAKKIAAYVAAGEAVPFINQK